MRIGVIVAMDKTITGLNDNVSSLQEESSKKTETINDQDAQLNTAWFAFGTKRDSDRSARDKRG